MKTRIRRLWTVTKSSWPVWLFIAVVVGLWGAWGQGARSAELQPCPPPSPVVFCPTEDACRPDYQDGRWVIIREVP